MYSLKNRYNEILYSNQKLREEIEQIRKDKETFNKLQKNYEKKI
jgi:hypothetical protein